MNYCTEIQKTKLFLNVCDVFNSDPLPILFSNIYQNYFLFLQFINLVLELKLNQSIYLSKLQLVGCYLIP